MVALAPAGAQAFVLRGSSWPGRPATITYFNATSYTGAVRMAASAWNHSGARVRFVAAPRSRARVVISYGSTLGGAFGTVAGFASIGKQPGSYVHLSRGGRGSVLVAVIAHELGHVLGLDHETHRCATMNVIVWDHCAQPPPCAVLQADDVRGAAHRYGGHARRRAALFCPGPPSAPSIQPAADAYGLKARFTMPRSPFVTGYVTRVRRGSCASRPGQLGLSGFAKPGQTVTTDVIPEGDPFAGAAGDYCLSVWSQGDFDRVGSRPLQVRFHWAPDAIPAPASLSAQQSQGAVTLTWPEVHHEELAGFKVDWAGGTTCPAAPGATAASAASGATGARVYPELRGPTCFAIWSIDRNGHLSATPATVVLNLAGYQAPYATFTPDYAYGVAGDPSATIQFADTSTDSDGHVVSWAWDFGDPDSGSANASTSPSPAHTYAQVGDYTVTLTVTDEDGLTSQAVGGVSISSP